MKSETIKVVFEYRIEYETDLGRAQAIRNALQGDMGSRGYVVGGGSYATEREHVGRIYGVSEKL